jgi:hypothetical protein
MHVSRANPLAGKMRPDRQQSTHEKIVRAGPATINRWRAENPKTMLLASDADFSGLDLSGADLSNSTFVRSLFRGATMMQVKFNDAHLEYADFTKCNLDGVVFSGATLISTKFDHASINRCNFDKSIAISRSKGLDSTRMSPGDYIASIDELRLPVIDHLIPWQRLRTVGRLPLFGLSYGTTGILFTYFTYLSYWHDLMGKAIKVINKIEPEGDVAEYLQTVRDWTAQVGPSTHSLLLLIATLSLGTGATLYLLGCPSKIQSFNIDEWEFSHGKPRIHYLASGWRSPSLRSIYVQWRIL